MIIFHFEILMLFIPLQSFQSLQFLAFSVCVSLAVCLYDLAPFSVEQRPRHELSDMEMDILSLNTLFDSIVVCHAIEIDLFGG